MNSKKKTKLSDIQKVGQVEHLAHLLVPELNRNFTVLSDTTESVFLQIKMIKPPKILDMIEIETISKEVRKGRFVMALNPRKLELDIYLSERSNEEKNRQRPDGSSNKQPRFRLIQRVSFSSDFKDPEMQQKFCFATLDQGLLSHYAPDLSKKVSKFELYQNVRDHDLRLKVRGKINNYQQNWRKVVVFMKLKREADLKQATFFEHDLEILVAGAKGSNETNESFEEVRKNLSSMTYENFSKRKDYFIEHFLTKYESPLDKLVSEEDQYSFNRNKSVESLILLGSLHLHGKKPWLIAQTDDFCSFRRTEMFEQNNVKQKGLILIRRKNFTSKYLVELETRFRAPIETEVFFLEDDKEYIKENLKDVARAQAAVPEQIKRESKGWFNIMSIRNKKLLKCFPDYIFDGVKTSERIKSPNMLRKSLKTKVAPLTCPVKFFSGTKGYLTKSNLFSIKDYVFEVNKDDSTIYMIAKGMKMGFNTQKFPERQTYLHPLEFYTPEKGFNVVYFNQKDNLIWLSNAKSVQEQKEKGKENEKNQQRLIRLNFVETPRAKEAPLPNLSKQPYDEMRVMFEENRFGYSEFLSKYFVITDSGLITFQDEEDFRRVHRVVHFNKEGQFERCKFKFLSSASMSQFEDKIAILQYNRFKNWRFVQFDFKKMNVLTDVSFEGEFSVKKDFELIQVEEVGIKKEHFFLISLVDSFFNRFVIGSLPNERQTPKNSDFVLRNLVDNTGKLVSSKIIKSNKINFF